jgi:hypothetical protein
MAVLKLSVGDVIRTRKTHPCGSDRWEIVRLGADIGIRCLGCDRRVLIPRSRLERRIKEFIHRSTQPPAGETGGPPAGPTGGPPKQHG